MITKSFNYDVAYETVSSDPVEGIIACGFLPKQPEIRQHNFIYYGGFLILSGKGTYINESGESFEIGPGDFVQRRPGIKHTTIVESGEPWLEFYICFGPMLYTTLTKIGVISDSPILHTRLDPDILGKCESLLYSFKKAKEKERKSLLLHVQSFLLHINRLEQEENISKDVEDIIEEISLRLSTDLDKKIDMTLLANRYHMSYESMRKIFKNKTGLSPHHYRILKRINEGKRLLHYPDKSVKLISDNIGYTDQYAFSNQFKKIVGVSPREFRKTL